MSAALRYQQRPPEVAISPNETAARLRGDLGGTDDAVNANALINAAECSSCAFRDFDGTCRAWSQRPLADGRQVRPKVTPNDWCACWRSH